MSQANQTHNLSRRAVLAGSTAALAAAVPVGAALSSPAPVNMKAATTKPPQTGDPVIGLVAKFKAAYRAYNEAEDAYEAAAHKAGYNICFDFEMTKSTTTKGEQFYWGRETILEAAARDEEWHVRQAHLEEIARKVAPGAHAIVPVNTRLPRGVPYLRVGLVYLVANADQ